MEPPGDDIVVDVGVTEPQGPHPFGSILSDPPPQPKHWSSTPGPPNANRRNNQAQDRTLIGLSQGVNRMNENLETLNASLGALGDLVKTSHSPQKKRGKGVGARPDADGTDMDADDEGPEARIYKSPKRRSKQENNLHVRPFLIGETLLTVLQGLIRAHTRLLLKLKPTDSLWCDVTRDEAEGYDISQGHPCTKDYFRLYLDGTPAHKWNQAAGIVFTKSFLEGRPGFEYDQVKKFFAVHLRTLVTNYRKQEGQKGMRENERDAAAALRRRDTRKQSVSHAALDPAYHR